MNTTLLTFSLLEAPLIIKDFVRGESSCNYELYITEVLNASQWMADHYTLPFVRPKSENNGECDAYAGDYGIDYKLIASNTSLHGASVFSLQQSKIADGAVATHSAKRSGQMLITRLAQALRGKSVAELREIQKAASRHQGIENDIKEYLETILTKKNLLLFFPYRFNFEENGDLGEDVQTILGEIQKDFCASLSYREAMLPDLDTFFLTMYDYYFVLCLWRNDSLSLLEIIPVEKADTFMDLIFQYSDVWLEKYLVSQDFPEKDN